MIHKVLFWIFFTELILHFTIFYAIQSNSGLMEEGSYFSIAGSFASKGALFAVKYQVFYGIPNIVNRIVGMKTTPLPRCIPMTHMSSELWKNFDTGIYLFIKK